jgi:hypothetical protein
VRGGGGRRGCHRGDALCWFQLLDEAGIGADRVTILVVAEFTAHRGRELLREQGFGKARVQSLMVFDGC